MRRLRDLWFRMRALLDRSAMQSELEEEFAFHLEKEAEKSEAQGLTPAEARRKARLKFGGEDRFKEKARESWGVDPLTDLGGDLRFAARQLRKNPAFSMLATLTLALGIGGTVALFSVVNGLMIRPLPVPDEDRVVAFWSEHNWRGEEFDLVKGVPEGFESVAAYSNQAYTLRTEAGFSLVRATVASGELFDVLRVRPLFWSNLRARGGPRGCAARRDHGRSRTAGGLARRVRVPSLPEAHGRSLGRTGRVLLLSGHALGAGHRADHVEPPEGVASQKQLAASGPPRRADPEVPVRLQRSTAGATPRRGEKLAAVGLARRTFGFSLAEAKGFVEDLLGPGSEPSP